MKKILFFLLFYSCFGVSGQVRLLHVGDSLACGIVFYVDSTSRHALVCARQDLPQGPIQWYNGNYPITRAVDDRLFDKGNADTIILIQGRTTSYAALLASTDSVQGCANWYLPSRQELLLIYQNLAVKKIGNFAPEGYWTSVEDDSSIGVISPSTATRAFIVDFYNGNVYSLDKVNTYHVRPILEFIQ